MGDWMESSTGAESEGNRGDGCIGATGVYQVSDGVVFYDTEEPLAWIQADDTVRLSEMA